MIRIKESGLRREENHRIQMTRRTQHCSRSSMHLAEDRDLSLRRRTRVTVGLYNVGLMARIIAGEIIIVLKRHRQWGIFDRIFLVFMQHWIIGRLIIRHILSRWKISFVIKLFLF